MSTFDEMSPERKLEISTAFIAVCVAITRKEIADGRGNEPRATHYREEAVRTWEEVRLEQES